MSMLAFLGTRGSFHRPCCPGPPTPYTATARWSFRDMASSFPASRGASCVQQCPELFSLETVRGCRPKCRGRVDEQPGVDVPGSVDDAARGADLCQFSLVEHGDAIG